MERTAPPTSPVVAPFWFGAPSRARRDIEIERLPHAARRAARDVEQLTQRARSVPEVRPEAVTRARRALRQGEIDSHTAIAAAVRSMRIGG